MTDSQNTPFSLLPGAMVEDMLNRSQDIGEALLKNFLEISNRKEQYRETLHAKQYLKHISSLPHVPPGTTVGVDGAQIIEKLLATDLVTCAALGIEGLTPPQETRYWERPNHKVYISPENHHPDTGTLLGGLMMQMEIIMAASPPHDVVFIDGSITTSLIKLNAALQKINDLGKTETAKEIIAMFPQFIESYHAICTSTRSDKVWVSIPKYTSKRELGEDLKWPSNFDDRAILTSILKAGEFTLPIKYQQPEEPWHLNIKNLQSYYPSDIARYKNMVGEIIGKLSDLHVCYFKPHPYTPALRLEISRSVMSNSHQLSMLLYAVSYQCGTPGIIDPYPLYLADRMVKSLSKAVPTFRQTATYQIAQSFDGDLSDILFNMHSYRTE